MRKVLLLLTLTFSTSLSFSTHIVGGDITVQDLGANTFNLSLRFYRDCSPGSYIFDPSIEVGLFDKTTHTLVNTFTINLTSTTPVSLGDACYAPNLCVEEGLYTDDVFIPDNPNGYYVSWQRCCRNSIINNIVNPGAAGLVFYAEIPDPATGNSTPVFGNYARTYMCVNTPNIIDFSANDVDGDFLKYSIVTPLNGSTTMSFPYQPNPAPSGPYSTITWQAPYSLNNVLGSTPNVAINPSTGILTVTPSVLGVFVFAVKVEEYRNGIKIGEIRRDIQYQVISCANPLTPGPSPTLTCTNTTSTISVSSTTPVSSYSWNGPTGGILSNGTTSTPTVGTSGTYTVIATTPTGCTYTASVTVNSNTIQPNVSINGNLTLTCQNQSGSINAASTTPGVNYSWSGPSGGITGSTTNSSATVSTTGTYTVTVTNPQNGCTASTTTIVNSNITLPDVTANGNLTLTCQNLSGNINASSSFSGLSYSWSGPTGGITGASTNSSVTVVAVGIYTVTVTNPQNGCTNTDTVMVNSNIVLPDVQTDSVLLTCIITSGTLHASSSTPGVAYLWSSNVLSNVTLPNATVNTAGTYTVTITNPANGCSATSLAYVYTLPSPIANADASATLINAGSTVLLSATGGDTYSWAPSTGLSCATCQTTTATPTDTTTYCVIVTDKYGCSDTACLKINVNNPCSSTKIELQLPNIFTPNGDENNDVLSIKDWDNECIKDFSIDIFDRWGLKMFESYGNNVSWDGRTASGTECSAGTYYYIIKYKRGKGEIETNKGFLTLVR